MSGDLFVCSFIVISYSKTRFLEVEFLTKVALALI